MRGVLVKQNESAVGFEHDVKFADDADEPERDAEERGRRLRIADCGLRIRFGRSLGDFRILICNLRLRFEGCRMGDWRRRARLRFASTRQETHFQRRLGGGRNLWRGCRQRF